MSFNWANLLKGVSLLIVCVYFRTEGVYPQWVLYVLALFLGIQFSPFQDVEDDR